MKRCELTKAEMTKDRVDNKSSPSRASSVYTFLLPWLLVFYVSKYGAFHIS